MRLDPFTLQLLASVIEIENDRALTQFSQEQFWSIRRYHLCQTSHQERPALASANLAQLAGACVQIALPSIHNPKRTHAPLKLGNFSNSTFSVTWNRLLRCFLGGVLAAMGMVSFGPCLSLLSAPALGGVAISLEGIPVVGFPTTPACKPSGGTFADASGGEPGWCGFKCGMGSAGISEETTTIGGAGEVLSANAGLPALEEPLSGVPTPPGVPYGCPEDPALDRADAGPPEVRDAVEEEGEEVDELAGFREPV